jgi:4-hydroxybenzoyl-CoA reductase subunit beta
MRLPRFQFLEPRNLEEATCMLGEHGDGCKIIGGGTDLLPSMKQGIFKPTVLLSLEKIPNLGGLEFDPQGGLRMGSLVKIRNLETDSLVFQLYPMIRQAAHVLASPQLRYMGTVGGNLSLDTRCYYYNQSQSWRKSRPRCVKMGGEVCNAIGGGKKCFAVFSGDLAPALMALGASVKLLSHRGERTLPLRDYYSGNGAKPLAKEPDEILSSVEVPPPPEGAYTTYLKYRIRKSIDFPLASLAAVLRVGREDKVCHEAKLVIGGVATRPQELKEVGEALKGERIEEGVIEDASQLGFRAAKPVANIASSPEYRRMMIKKFVQRALQEALNAHPGCGSQTS